MKVGIHMTQKYYAVRKGQQPGIYRTWPETQKQVNGYPHAEYKSFTSEAEAQAFMAGKSSTPTHSKAKHSKSTATSNQPAIKAAITVYTDGGSRNTGNVAGQHVHAGDRAAWAYRIELPDQLVTDSAGEWGATNNRMEIMAFLEALKQLVRLDKTDAEILFVLDSQYVLNAVTKGWLSGWKRRGWKRSNGELVNAELWQAVDPLLPKFKHLNYRWTKGHATNQGNVFVDHLLNQAMDQMVAGQPAQVSTGATISQQRTSSSTQKTAARSKTISTQPQVATPKPTSDAQPADPETVQMNLFAK